MPLLTALPPVIGKNNSVTLSCEAYRLKHKQINLYSWSWSRSFSKDDVIKKSDKYKIYTENSFPNSCQHSKCLAYLQIANTSKDDVGQYFCELKVNRTTLGKKDVRFHHFGKLHMNHMT